MTRSFSFRGEPLSWIVSRSRPTDQLALWPAWLCNFTALYLYVQPYGTIDNNSNYEISAANFFNSLLGFLKEIHSHRPYVETGLHFPLNHSSHSQNDCRVVLTFSHRFSYLCVARTRLPTENGGGTSFNEMVMRMFFNNPSTGCCTVEVMIFTQRSLEHEFIIL